MSLTQSVSLGGGTLVGILLPVIVFQGAVQEANTQTEGQVGDPTFQEGTQPTFATGEIIVNLPP